MEKKTINVHAITVHMYTIAIVVLSLIVVVLGLKYLHLKLAVGRYTQSAMWQNSQQKPTGSASDYAAIVATTVSQYPTDKPLLTQPMMLQQYVATLSKNVFRDIVVLDHDKKILADTIGANKGAAYTYDKGEIKMTLSDGQRRTFLENSQDYPDGIIETVVPMRNASNEIIGAVLVSSTQVFK